MTAFASTADTAEKPVTFARLAEGVYAYTAQGDPNTGIIVGDDCCMVVDTQATPLMARDVIARVRQVTPKPIRYVLLSHYHAVRVLGASAYDAHQVIAHEATRKLIVERGAEDMASEIGRFPRLFRGQDTIPGLTTPTLTFTDRLTLHLGKRKVEIWSPGRGHTAGDTVAFVPDAGVLFSGDLVEQHSACYCGDAFLREWPETIERMMSIGPWSVVPGRGEAITGKQPILEAFEMTELFVTMLYDTARSSVAKNMSLKETYRAVRTAMDVKFSTYAIYEHCQPFNVARAYDEARGIDWPKIWTAERDREMWTQLQG